MLASLLPLRLAVAVAAVVWPPPLKPTAWLVPVHVPAAVCVKVTVTTFRRAVVAVAFVPPAGAAAIVTAGRVV